MMCRVGLCRSALLLLTGLLLSGCLPTTSQLDEEKEPHFLAGKGLANAMDYKGAIEAFEKSLEVNPQSASAHFELGWLFDRKDSDPAAAIYHYEKYLQFRANAGNADLVQQRILYCKQELARTVSLGPVSEKLTHELEQLTEDNKRLTDQNKLLTDELTKWRAYYAGRALTPGTTSNVLLAVRSSTFNDSTPGAVTSGASPTNAVGRSNASSFPMRTHVVKPGETPSFIARSYGVRLEALMAANPKLDPRRMRAGQTLSIPSP